MLGKVKSLQPGWFKIAAILTIFILASFLAEYFRFSHYFNQYHFLFILAISSLFLVFYVSRKKIGEHPEIGFLAVALICGTLLAVSEPKKFVSWDEPTHYARVEHLAANLVNNMYFRPNTTPTSYSIEEQNKIDASVDSKYKVPKIKSITQKLTFAKLVYVPSAIALAIGNLLHLPYHIIFEFGRWINLLFYSIIVFFAIRKLKSGKMILSVVALFPTAIFLSVNYSTDSWIIAFTMLGMAYLFSELQQTNKKIAIRDVIIMIGALIIGFGPKAIYFPLLFLVFLLRPGKFNSPKQYKLFVVTVSISILLVIGSFMVPFLIEGPGTGDSRGGEGTNATEQVKFILTEPVVYAKTLVNFMFSYINPKNAYGFITFFAYLGTFKKYLFALALIILGIVTFTDKNKFDQKTASWKVRLAVIGTYLATVAIICTVLYISYTPVRYETILGVQPRYLIPLIFPLLFILGSSRVENSIRRGFYNTVIFALVAYIFLQGTWDLIIRNYY